MDAKNETTVKTEGADILTTRMFDATPTQLFAAWADAAWLDKWWGPHGFQTKTRSFDFRPGGEWRYTMHAPDGTQFHNRVVFRKIALGERLESDHYGEGDGTKPMFRHTITFEARGERTLLTMRHTFQSTEARELSVAKFGAAEGAKQTFARLGEHLPTPAEGLPELRLSRTFDAPVSLVWKAWTRAEYVSKWFTPAPLTTPSCEVDLRPGGVFNLVMKMPNGFEHPMNATFAEVVPNERLVFVAMIPEGLLVHTNVTFKAVGDKTQLDVHQLYARVTDSVRGAPMGWKATLDQLGQVVATFL